MERAARWWHMEKWRAFLAIGSSFFVIVWSTSMTFVLLPDIAAEFDVTLGAVGWVVIIEALIISALLLPFGGIADAIGRKSFLVAGLGVFAIGSVATGLAPSFTLLIAARASMSIGNAMVQAVGTGALVASFAPHERGVAMGAQTIAVSLGAASGPLVGGYALEYVSWGWLFVILAIPSGFSIAATLAFLAPDAPRKAASWRPSDPIGAILSGLAVTGLIISMGDPFGVGFGSWAALAVAVATVVLVAWFIKWELRQAAPVIDVRLFALPVVRIASTIRVLGFSAATTLQLLLPILLVSVRGVTPGTAGVVAAMMALGMAVGAKTAGPLYDRIGPRLPTMSGLIAQAALLLVFSRATSDTPIYWLAGLALVFGVAQSIWNVPNNSALMGAPPASALSVMGAFTNVNRTLGNVVGQTLAASIVVRVMVSDGFDIPLDEIADVAGASASFERGWWFAFALAAALSIAGAVLASRLPRGTG